MEPHVRPQELFTDTSRIAVGGQADAEDLQDDAFIDEKDSATGQAPEDTLPGVGALGVHTGRGAGKVRGDLHVEVVLFHAWPTPLC